MNPVEKYFRFKSIDVRNSDVIGKIKTSKGFGTDNISSYFLELAMPYIENSLAYIYNTSLQISKLNYRPISVLPVISRLFENLVFEELYQYLDHNGLLSPS